MLKGLPNIDVGAFVKKVSAVLRTDFHGHH